MKKISVLMAAFMAVCMSALADDVVSVNPNPVQVSPGDRVTLEVVFDNSEGLYKGFQLDIKMPEGLEVVSEEVYDEEEEEYVTAMRIEQGTLCKSAHQFKSSQLAPGYYRFVCFNGEGKTFKTGKGTVMAVTFESSETITTGEFKGILSGIEFNTSDDKAVLFDDVEFKVLVVPTKINDVSASKQTKGIYNVAGQQVEMQKGINIVDGKKVMVK